MNPYCSCGLSISPSQQARHETSRWHAIADQARELYRQGLTFADIARQFGVTRAYISQKVRLAECQGWKA